MQCGPGATGGAGGKISSDSERGMGAKSRCWSPESGGTGAGPGGGTKKSRNGQKGKKCATKGQKGKKRATKGFKQ